MTSAAHYKAVVLLLLIHCLLLPPLFCGGLWLVLVMLCTFAIISLGKKEGWFTLIAFLCHLTGCILCLFLMVLRVGLQCVIVAFPSHTTYFFL